MTSTVLTSSLTTWATVYALLLLVILLLLCGVAA